MHIHTADMQMCTNISLILKLQNIRNPLTEATRQTTVLFGKHNWVSSTCLWNSQGIIEVGQSEKNAKVFLGSVVSLVTCTYLRTYLLHEAESFLRS
jgi:hypothetical protein